MKKFLLGAMAALSISSMNAQGFYDLNTIQKIEITFSQTNWDQILDAAASSTEDYTMATAVVINGTSYDSVGVKYKGNSTYSANQTKNPFHIELDTYKDQDYEGFKDIKLSNVAKDPSFLREVLSYQILGQYMHSPLSNYANVYVNGTLMGLYSNSEAITKTFVDEHFYSKDNTFIKCNPIDGAGPGSTALPNLVYINQNSSSYDDAYELKSDNATDWQQLINLCDTLKNNTQAIEDILDVDRAIWMLAFDNVLVNLDSYIGGFAQNYYLYRDDNNRFNPIVWDLNESFGAFAMTGSGSLNSTNQKIQMSHLLNINDTDYPLVQELLAIPMFKKMYLAHYKTILLENFDNGSYETTALSLQTLIDASVQADVNKFYTYQNFLDNLSSDIGGGGGPGGGQSVNGITNLMDARSTYLLNLSDFTNTQPTISNILLSNGSPVLNETITITADVTDENDVYLGYRASKKDRFIRVQMYDDGAHNDGAANDGTYGVDLLINDASIHYYIYAENSNIGKFSPVRAEHEYYRIDATAAQSTITGLVINEFLASNGSTNFDEAAEYDDWIELYNNTNIAIDLSGFYLSDDLNELTQWEFPAGSSIPANGYFTVWLDNDDTQGDYHANFKLSADGETVYLCDQQAAAIDQETFGEQTTDIAWGRYANGTGIFQSLDPTFGKENQLYTSVNDLDQDLLNLKVFPNPANNSFTIELSETLDQAETASVYNVYGKKVYQNTISSSLTIETSSWSAGIYYVTIKNSTTKLIVMK